MTTTYLIPVSDVETFAELPITHQVEIQAMLQVFWRVDHAQHGTTMQVWHDAIRDAHAYLQSHGVESELKRQTLYGIRKRFHEAGKDWAACVDRRKAPEWDPHERCMMLESNKGLPEAFIEYFQGLALRNNRSSSQAIEEVYRNWRRGDAIPGYGVWTSWFAREFPLEPMPPAARIPDGWGRRNLRRYLPQPAALAMARRGVAAATAMLPSIMRTRAGLRPMEYVVFDDWRADFMTFVPGIKEAVELHGILAMDVACALALCYGIRPALPRADGSAEGLKRCDTKSLLVDLLLRHGYPLDYTMNVIVENGTATITPADARAVEEVTQGQIKFHWTSMISGTVFGWPDRPVGNFKGKAWLESFFNLLHNACGNIAGQIGPHYEDRPRSIPARDAELRALVKAQESLPVSVRESLQYRMPFPHIRDAKTALDHVFHHLNHREQHALEGWDVVLKVRLSEQDPWRPVSELVAAGQNPETLRALNPQPIRETPAERSIRLRQGVRFAKLPMAAVPLLLANHREVVIETEGEVNMGSKSSPLLYRDLRSPYLTVGRKLLAYQSSTDDAWIHLTDGRRYICSVPRLDAIGMGDRDALQLAAREKYGQLKRTLKAVQRLDPDVPQRIADLDHNLAIAEQQVNGTTLLIPAVGGVDAPVNHAGLSEAEQALADSKERRAEAARRIREASGDLADIFERGQPVAVDQTSSTEDAVDQLAKLI
jgi:hypothetical protein